MGRPNKALILLAKFSVSTGLLWFVISKAGFGKVVGTLREINPVYFVAAVAIYLVSLYISSFRWRLFLDRAYSVRRLFSLYLIGSFFNHLLPGIVGGDAVKAYYLYRDTGKSAPAVASVFMDRYIGFTSLLIIGGTAFPFGFKYFSGSYIEWILPLIVIFFIAGSFFVFGLKIGKRFRFLSGFYEYFSLYVRKRGVILQTLILSMVLQVFIIFGVFLLCRGLKVEIPLIPLFVFIPVINTISFLPISISGIGVREASFVLLFSSLGIGPVESTAVSFAWFLSFVAGSSLGFIEYLRYKKAG